MAKVSIGLRGWRFEESEVFTEDGEFKPLDDIPEDPRNRLVRLTYLVEQPCDACYLVHGDENVERCTPAAIVYGEPTEEVVLCADHEADFLYWYREAGGKARRGEETFRDEFHEWFDGGGRAPEGYAGLDHVDTDPAALPNPPDPQEVQERLAENFEGRTIDLRKEGDRPGDRTREDEEELETDDLDLDADYPSR